MALFVFRVNDTNCLSLSSAKPLASFLGPSGHTCSNSVWQWRPKFPPVLRTGQSLGLSVHTLPGAPYTQQSGHILRWQGPGLSRLCLALPGVASPKMQRGLGL